MQSSRDLFDLVHSMTSHERRYFKMHATFHAKGKHNTYTRLFDAIANVPLYDEDRLRRRIRNEPFSTHLASAKNKLGKLLLQSLAAYHAGKTVTPELHEILQNVKTVYDKGLHSYCKKLLASARKKAEKLELDIVLLEIYQWERRLLIDRHPENLEAEMLCFYGTVDLWTERLSVTMKYLELLDRMQAACRRYQRVRKPEDREILDELAAHPLLVSEKHANTFTAKVARLTTLSDYAWINGSTARAFELNNATVALWESRPDRIKENVDGYRGSLCNLATMMIATGNDRNFTNTAKKIKSLPFRSTDARLVLFETVYYLELLYYLNRGLPEAGLKLARKIDGEIGRYAARINGHRVLTLHYNCVLVYFLNDCFAEALQHIHTVLNMRRERAKKDIRIVSRLLQLVCLYELRHTETLESALRSVQRYFKKIESILPFERFVFRHIQRLLNKVPGPSTQKSFRQLQRELQQIPDTASESLPLGFMEILIWVESRLTARTINAVYREKIASKQR